MSRRRADEKALAYEDVVTEKITLPNQPEPVLAHLALMLEIVCRGSDCRQGVCEDLLDEREPLHMAESSNSGVAYQTGNVGVSVSEKRNDEYNSQR